MAEHIHSIKDCTLPKVSKEVFYSKLQGGDLIFCSGRASISKGIEFVTSSPFSHVLMTWTTGYAGQWLTLESTIDKGVHVGLLSDYVDGYNGDLVLARRPLLSLTDIMQEVKAGLTALDDTYDWRQEVSIVGHKLIKALPIVEPKKEYYCSGLQYFMSLATKYPLKKPGPNYPTPEDNYTDSTVQGICALLKS